MIKFSKIGIAADNTSADKHVYEACIKMDKLILDIEEIHILHAKNLSVAERRALDDNNNIKEMDNAFEISLHKEMLEKAISIFGDEYANKIHVHILDGHTVDEIIKFQAANPMDLYLAGKKQEKKRRGHFAKELIRKIDVSVLMIPDGMPNKWKLEDILVPYDFSKSSDQAMLEAIDIKKNNSLDRIDCFHLCETPSFNSGSFSNGQKLTEAMKEERHDEFKQKIEELSLSEPPNFVVQIVINFLHKEIIRRANGGNYDLIIMGAKGHSAIERFFLGSVTEKVINQNNKLPLLVIKQ